MMQDDPYYLEIILPYLNDPESSGINWEEDL
jgi:hypothetical protein